MSTPRDELKREALKVISGETAEQSQDLPDEFEQAVTTIMAPAAHEATPDFAGLEDVESVVVDRAYLVAQEKLIQRIHRTIGDDPLDRQYRELVEYAASLRNKTAFKTFTDYPNIYGTIQRVISDLQVLRQTERSLTEEGVKQLEADIADLERNRSEIEVGEVIAQAAAPILQSVTLPTVVLASSARRLLYIAIGIAAFSVLFLSAAGLLVLKESRSESLTITTGAPLSPATAAKPEPATDPLVSYLEGVVDRPPANVATAAMFARLSNRLVQMRASNDEQTKRRLLTEMLGEIRNQTAKAPLGAEDHARVLLSFAFALLTNGDAAAARGVIEEARVNGIPKDAGAFHALVSLRADIPLADPNLRDSGFAPGFATSANLEQELTIHTLRIAIFDYSQSARTQVSTSTATGILLRKTLEDHAITTTTVRSAANMKYENLCWGNSTIYLTSNLYASPTKDRILAALKPHLETVIGSSDVQVAPVTHPATPESIKRVVRETKANVGFVIGPGGINCPRK